MTHPTQTPPSSERLSLLSRLLLVSLALIAFAAGIGWAGTFSGPYRWLVELQLDTWEAYSPEITWAVLLVSLAVFTTLAMTLATRLGILRTVSGEPIPFAVWKTKVQASTQWMRERKVRLACLGAGIFIVGAGAGECLRSASSGALTDVDVATLAAGPPPSHYLRVRGRALTEAAVTFETQGRADSSVSYIPLVPLDWQPSQPIGLFLKRTDLSRVAGDADRSFSGVLAYALLPGMVRHEFQNRGLKPTEKPLVLDWGEKPDDLVLGGAIQIVLGFLLAVGTGLFWVIFGSRKAQKTAPAAPLAPPR